MSVEVFGIRHHGPGSAASLMKALQDLRPDIVLLEGPPDGDAVAALAGHADMQPPVALLIYPSDRIDLQGKAAYYPFAHFSPEWNALRYALEQQIPVPLDGSEDDAVAAVIADYEKRTGVTLDEDEVRQQVRELRAQATDG